MQEQDKILNTWVAVRFNPIPARGPLHNRFSFQCFCSGQTFVASDELLQVVSATSIRNTFFTDLSLLNFTPASLS